QQQLSSGPFYGRAVRHRVVGGLHLIETHYAPGSRLPRHSHQHGYFCLVRRGQYREEYGGRVRSCGPLTVVFHPPGEVHAEQFAGDETWSFNTEITDSWLARWANSCTTASPNRLRSANWPPRLVSFRFMWQRRFGGTTVALWGSTPAAGGSRL